MANYPQSRFVVFRNPKTSAPQQTRKIDVLPTWAGVTNKWCVRDETSTHYSSVPCVAKTAVQYWQWTRDVLACLLSIWFPTVYGSNERTESVPSISCQVV